MLGKERRRHAQCQSPVFKSERRHRLEPGVVLFGADIVGDYAQTILPQLLMGFAHRFVYTFLLKNDFFESLRNCNRLEFHG